MEFRAIVVRIVEFRSEDNHDTILEEVIELCGGRIESLIIQIMSPV